MTIKTPQGKSDQYLKQKAAKKKTGNKALILFLSFLVITVCVVVKIFLSGSLKPAFLGGMPNSDDAYDIAKEFVKPTLNATSLNFHDEGYQFGKQSDSVYIIQSTVESIDNNGEKLTTGFKVVMKYNGGQANKKKNWSLIDINVR